MIEPFRQEMETVFDRFFGEENGNGHGLRTWTPRVDVEETDREIIVKADVPGVDPKAVEVSVENGVLTIRGEKKEEKEEKKKGYHRVERFAGSFYRAVTLPPGADADKVSATSSNGVVTVTILKKAEAQPKKIIVTPKA
ncbi:MAG: Hsp20/alpha crystallin family protein [Planctomycetes bacterium]|nr:Hsp20/alpha crystallin family protein [Planctomycetota bacterium]